MAANAVARRYSRRAGRTRFPKAKAAAPRDVSLLDALSKQIAVARGIQLAIMGEAHITGFNSFPLSELCEQHIDRLKAIMEGMEGAA